MKALLMSVKAGYGHHSTAKAIMDYFSKNGFECEMLDIFEFLSPHLGDNIQNGYLILTKYLKKPYGKIYDLMDEKEDPYDKKSIISILSKLVSMHISKYVLKYSPDVIIGTHSYAGYVMTLLRESGAVSCPLIGIVTDYTIHPFWESTKLDRYVVQDKLLEQLTSKKGIPVEKILPIGIPIREAFSQKGDKREARKKLGIADKPTMLFMMGSMGFGNMKKLLLDIDAYPADFQILCVCGNNAKTEEELKETEWTKDIFIYGFVNNVDVMMDASDFIVTKPGGLTTAETLAKGLPMIVINPIPGQENKNMAFLVNNGAAISVNNEYPIEEALNQLLNTPWRVKLLKESVEHLSKPNATKDLYDITVHELLQKDGDTVNSIPAM